MKICIASDFHLSFSVKSNEERERNRVVLDFLSSIKEADMLILAGDIFDLWYDWKKVIIKDYFPYLKKMAELAENNCRIIYIAGNHDFWFGSFLQEYLNCEMYKDYFEFETDGNKIFVAHGDFYASNDLRYKLFHFFLRSKLSRILFSSLHPNIALSLGKAISRTSRDRSMRSNIRPNGMEKYAEKIADKYDVIIMGHSHKPIMKKIKDKTYLNTGFWGNDNSFIEITDGIIKLLQFNPNNSK